jgi:hypothetical protein
VLKLFDPNMEVLEARLRKGGDIWFIDARRIVEEEKSGITVKNPGAAPVVGKAGVVHAHAGEDIRSVPARPRDAPEVAEAYQIPAASLRENPCSMVRRSSGR